MSWIISVITLHLCRKSNVSQVDRVFRKLQLLSSAAYSLGHGGNDAQKVIELLALPCSHGMIADIDHIPEWVPLSCYTAIAFRNHVWWLANCKKQWGNVTKLTPLKDSVQRLQVHLHYFTQHFKIPVSTTHTITGSIIGVGLTKRISAVRWE